ncbi:MAG: N-acetyltransferase [Ignavibacteriae bacterium]|nr:N-acetyltransferase [Ignavibacteriota bacterium]MCB9249974.1 N-acetyltransferase [Ignavibacteriales bacterium]
MNLEIRIANPNDWKRIIEIYNQAILEGAKTADTEIVTVEQRKDWLELHEQKRYPILVAEIDSHIIGWCSISPHRAGRKALEITAEISYYIDFGHRQKGIATILIQKAIEQAKENYIQNLYAILLDVNSNSIRILEKFGFEKWGYLPKVAKIKNNLFGQFIYGKNI